MPRLITLLFLIFSDTAAFAKPEESDSLFKKISPLVFRVKTALTANAPKASYGSGFVVDEKGLLITNYHVISDVVQGKGGYQNFVIMNEKPIPAEILGFDVVHDLALIKIDHVFPTKITFSGKEPTIGESIFSFGIPMDQNLSIGNGLFNGFRKQGPFEEIQMSTPVNSGMSGGPTTDSKGNLVGVNVSALKDANNLTFSVPARHVKKLLQDSKIRPFQKGDKNFYHTRIEEQLSQAQAEVMKDIAGTSMSSRLSEWTFKELPEYFKCWMARLNSQIKSDMRKMEQTELQCQLEQVVFLEEKVRALSFKSRLIEMRNKKLNPFQFSDAIQTTLNHWTLSEKPFVEEEFNVFGRFSCDEEKIWNQEGLPVLINFCARKYILYPSLFQTVLKFAVIDPKAENTLLGVIRMDGYSQLETKNYLMGFLNYVKRK
jgi:hypothetical protein